MDAELLKRFIDGDPGAVTATRNHLRAVASRVLTAPQWRLTEPLGAAAELAAAQEAMAGGGKDAITLVADTMAAAARLALEAVRSSEANANGSHLASSLLVELAMERASANQAAHARPHLEACVACKRHLDQVAHAMRAAATASAAPLGLVSPEQHGASADLLLAAAAAAAAEPEGEDEAPDAAPRPRRPGSPRATSPRPTKARVRPRQADRSALTPLLLVALLVGGMAWWQSRLTPEEQGWRAAALLPPEWPPAGQAALYDGEVRDALEGMATKGQCSRAAVVLHKAWLLDGDDLNLRWYEGLAHVCQRDGRAAVDALREVERLSPTPRFGLQWWLGQALLLDGQTEAGVAQLSTLALSEHPRAEQARELVRRAREEL